MSWIFDHFQIVIIIGLAFASWVKHRADRANADQEERQTREEMADGNIFGTDEGWEPQPSAPPPFVPPPLMRQATPPPLQVDAPNLEVLLKRQQDRQDRLLLNKDVRATTTGDAAATRARVSASRKSPNPSFPAKPACVQVFVTLN